MLYKQIDHNQKISKILSFLTPLIFFLVIRGFFRFTVMLIVLSNNPKIDSFKKADMAVNHILAGNSDFSDHYYLLFYIVMLIAMFTLYVKYCELIYKPVDQVMSTIGAKSVVEIKHLKRKDLSQFINRKEISLVKMQKLLDQLNIFQRETESLSLYYGLKDIKIYVIPNRSINALSFANYNANNTINQCGIAITLGALERCTANELDAIIGHEITHLANYDTKNKLKLKTISMGLCFLLTLCIVGMKYINPFRSIGIITFFLFCAGFCCLVCFAFISLWGVLFAWILNLLFNRKREYLADAYSVKMNDNANAMISVLNKIKTDKDNGIKYKKDSTNNQYSLLYFDDNLSLFDSHPSIKSRIKHIKNFVKK